MRLWKKGLQPLEFQCRKCGGKDIRIDYCRSKDHKEWGEHFHCECRRCHYAWISLNVLVKEELKE